MTRQRKQPVELVATDEELRQKVSRRRLMQLAGAGGASFVAGCGGGGGDESPTATATEAPAQETPTEAEEMETDTPTPTEAEEEEDTPTPTETETIQTPSGQTIEIVDRQFKRLKQLNLEQATLNPWNSENAFQPELGTLQLMVVPETMQAPPEIENSTSVVFPGIAKSIEVNFDTNEVSVELQDDPPVTFGDDTVCNVDNVFAHWDLVQGQIEMGEASESALPISWEANDEFSFSATLLPGNTQIRLFEAFFQGDLVNVQQTHPELHSEWIEGVRDATTTSALQSIYQELFSARFGFDQMPEMSNGPFMPTDWNPSRILFQVREDYPWGLSTGLSVDRMFSGARLTAVATGAQGEEQLTNATINNKQDVFQFFADRLFQRFPDSWERWEISEATGGGLWFQPGRKKTFGAKTEKARKLRKGTNALFDVAELAAINDLKPSYEPTMGFFRKSDFEQWIGDSYGQYENFGNRDEGYVKQQKGNQYFQDAGFQKNKNGFWVDQNSGEVLESVVFLGTDQDGAMDAEPVLRNIPEQLNDMGIKATGKLVGGEQLGNATAERKGDMIFTSGNCEMHPHPYFGYREDCGLGSTEGLPVGLWWGDWHNGYRRVKVPFPIGSVDGELATYDWDKNVLEIAQLSPEEIDQRIEELSWVLNQWQPGIYAIATTANATMNTDRIVPTDAWSDPTLLGKPPQTYGAGELWNTSDIEFSQQFALGLLEPA